MHSPLHCLALSRFSRNKSNNNNYARQEEKLFTCCRCYFQLKNFQGQWLIVPAGVLGHATGCTSNSLYDTCTNDSKAKFLTKHLMWPTLAQVLKCIHTQTHTSKHKSIKARWVARATKGASAHTHLKQLNTLINFYIYPPLIFLSTFLYLLYFLCFLRLPATPTLLAWQRSTRRMHFFDCSLNTMVQKKS